MTNSNRNEENELFEDSNHLPTDEGYDAKVFDDRIEKRSSEDRDEDQSWKTVYLHEKDHQGLEETANSLEEPFNPSALILYHLTNSLLERLNEGQYDPHKLAVRVGANRKQKTREKIDIRPRGDLKWLDLENTVDRLNKDQDLAHVRMAKEGSSITYPVRKVSEATIFRAAAREIAKGTALFSREPCLFWAEDLRKNVDGGELRPSDLIQTVSGNKRASTGGGMPDQ